MVPRSRRLVKSACGVLRTGQARLWTGHGRREVPAAIGAAGGCGQRASAPGL